MSRRAFAAVRGVGHQLHVPLRGAVARLAVDRERGDVRIPFLRDGVEADVDLAAVTSLAVREAGLVAEYALWRPVAAVGEPEMSAVTGTHPLSTRDSVLQNHVAVCRLQSNGSMRQVPSGNRDTNACVPPPTMCPPPMTPSTVNARSGRPSCLTVNV